MDEPKKAPGRPKKIPVAIEQLSDDSLDNPTKIKALREEISKLKHNMETYLQSLKTLQDAEAELRNQKEPYSVSHQAYLEQCKKTAEQEAITNEQAIAAIKEQSKKSQLDRVMGAKPGFGTRRPAFVVKGDK